MQYVQAALQQEVHGADAPSRRCMGDLGPIVGTEYCMYAAYGSGRGEREVGPIGRYHLEAIVNPLWVMIMMFANSCLAVSALDTNCGPPMR